MTYWDFPQSVFPIEQRSRTVTIILYQASNGNLHPQRRQHIPNSTDLPLTPICEDKVWQRLLCLHHTTIATCHNLLHRSVIIWPFDRADIKLSIILLRGTASFENDTSSYRV